MKTTRPIAKRLLSIVLCLVLMMTYAPLAALAADGSSAPYFNRVVDAPTMDNWENYFLKTNDTSNAGGVWTDKSVFTDASEFNGLVTMQDDSRNFLTALSAIAANKEIVGYSTVPTDTVLVLDLSGSMSNSDSEDDLIDAANEAIDRLLAVNNNNRVGVVLYSAAGVTGSSTYTQSITRILPIDRYATTATDRNGSPIYLNLSNSGNVSVNSNVTGTIANANLDEDKSFGGGTYIQAGLWEAMEMFQEMDTVIGENNWQTGDNRMPILVLMSDGAPSTGTSNYDNVDSARSNVGNGSEDNLTAGNAFLTQLTASYVMSQIEAHYQQKDANVRGLFYTLGFNIGNNSIATSVMNPDASTITDTLWRSYSALGNGTLSVRVKNTSGNFSNVAIRKNSYVTNKSYVDEYFSASGDGLSNAFGSIVDEIILQSRYYPTHLEGGSPDFSGYVEFEDTLGEYMEVKHINGILLGDILYDGHMMASKIADNTSDGLGTVENPTALGDEFIRAVKTRLGIASTADAQTLVANAFAAGQLKYNSDTDWSNYIGWYAKADGTYAGFWDENSTAAAPRDAVYTIKSYGFLGETTGSIKNSDMMYMSVQVRTDIATGQQTMLWKIPAALVPMVTYLVTLKGTHISEAQDVRVTIENETKLSPIRLIFESGLRSDLNELNITRITDDKHIAEDGVTRQFWTNYFDISAESHDQHITTLAEFTPSLENERFYYAEASAVHKQIAGADTETTADDRYALVGENETLDENGTYFHRRYIFVRAENVDAPVFFYEKMSKESIREAKKNGWNPTFKTLDKTLGAWVVPAGTPARELEMYDQQKKENLTASANMVFHPYLTEQNDIFYVDMNLGNNGRLEVTPAQGIKLSKTIDVYEPGTSSDFRFRITVKNANGTAYTGKLNSWITDLDVVPLGAPNEITLPASGIYTVELSSNQTLWLTGVSTGATYTIEEVSTNDDYKIKSVHVNGVSTGTIATGTVAAYFIDDVDFVNTAIGEGDLVITKQVVDENGRTVDIKDDIRFTAQVTLTDANNNPISGTFGASNDAGSITLVNGTFTVTLAEGESFVIRNIPEETKYTVTETNIPAGFALNTDRSRLTGAVDAQVNDQALIVNTYDPVGTNGQNVTVDVTKTISGNRSEWLANENYSFTVKRTNAADALAQFTIDANDADKKYTLNLTNESYPEAGTYHYSIVESVGTQGGITYDTVERRFAVVVADADMDGDLEITAVNNEAYTTVTQSGNAYTVSANFNNVYAPTGSATAEIAIKKAFLTGNHALSGYQFVLYDEEDNEILRSRLTDANGDTTIRLTYSADQATMAGVTYTYYLAEINGGQTINNIKYTDKVYPVAITVKDNGDGTISATTTISGLDQGTAVPTFVNEYVPSTSDYVTISGIKTISTGNRAINANEFEFVLTAVTPGAPMPAETKASNAANGSFAFGAIEFGDAHKGNTYKYTVSEVNTQIGGFTYDTTVYTVTVDVVDNGNTTITATATVTGGDDSGNIVFDNLYNPKPATATLTGEKILTGKTLVDGDFTFVLTPTGSTTLPDGYNNTAKNVGRAITFNTLTFDRVGVYTYTVTEQGEDNANFDYDESVYAITITVTDNARGVLSADVKMSKNSIPSTGIVFRNGFVPTPIPFDISAIFGGIKDLEGRTMEAGEFEFELINAINGQKIGESVKNDADGNFAFPAVTLPEAGIYRFKITEVVGDEKGVTYDTSAYHVRLEVVQDDAGKLHVNDQRLYKGTVTKQEVGGVLTEVVSYENITDGGKITFNNSYKADPTHVIVEGTKTLTGRELKAEEFSFVLYDQAGEEIETVKNAADGSFAFAPISVAEAGEYVYTVKEMPGSEEGITYDSAVFTVTVTVSDNLDGTFKVEYAYAKDNAEAESLTFANVYTPKEEIPSTGDHSPYLWVAMLFVSGGLMGATIYGKKRKEAEEN